jgi:hypothetical protein
MEDVEVLHEKGVSSKVSIHFSDSICLYKCF